MSEVQGPPVKCDRLEQHLPTLHITPRLEANAVKQFSSGFQQLSRGPFSTGKGIRWPTGRMRGGDSLALEVIH